MIDPVIFTINFGNFSFSLYWYGVLVMLGVVVATWLTGREFERRGQDSAYIWDSLLWILPAGIMGARLWYVANVTLGGDMRYMQDPIAIINLRQGGLHYFGAILFGAIAFYFYAKKMGLDLWLALDAVSPGLLLGQAIARPANFINQELYGQPTELLWGIKIDAMHRLAPWNDLSQYPLETIRFHPTFAYEMLWNLFAIGILLILGRRYKDKMKPGVVFGAWLILAGLGRNIIEFFRPDQPTFPGTAFSYSRFVAILMIVAGILLILIKYKVIVLGFVSPGKDTYKIVPPLEELLNQEKSTKKHGNTLENSENDKKFEINSENDGQLDK